MLVTRKDGIRARGTLRGCGLALALALAHVSVASPAPQDAAARNYDAQDARLNAVYKKLMQSLDEPARKALRDEERQWVAGRDQSCGVPPGSTAKNECTTTQASFRADELESRLKKTTGAHAATAASGVGAAGGTAILGDWGYRSDCNLGHAAQLGVTASTAKTAEGTWSDGTHQSGSQGRFKGEWRDGKLYTRFCADPAERGGYPACPAYGDVSAYVVPEGKRLAWYQVEGPASEGNYSKYVTLDRVPKGGRAPLDTQCKDAP
jgi:uncharacterized protein YecT (DUF1311 family)